jgi:hypothetical protein
LPLYGTLTLLVAVYVIHRLSFGTRVTNAAGTYAGDDSFQPEQHHPVGGHLELVELRPAWTVGCHEPSYDSTYVTGNAPLLARRRVSFRERKLRNLH